MKVTDIIVVLFQILVLSTNGYSYHFESPMQFLIKSFKTTSFDERVQEKWLTQQLDHFNPFNNQTFQMRYLENDRYFKTGGPILILVGGEWTIGPEMISNGWLIHDIAKQTNGILFYTEHRFYGRSQPFSNLSTINLEHFNVDQAMADLAHFIDYIKANDPVLRFSRTFMAGFSYAGQLVSHFRQVYPHKTQGAWVSSAPLIAQTNFPEFREVVTYAIRLIGGEKCSNRIERAIQGFEDLINRNETTRIEKLLNLCNPLDVSNKFDVMGIYRDLANRCAAMVQYHNLLFDIEEYCNVILDESHADDIEAYAVFFNMFDQHLDCHSFRYQEVIDILNDVDVKAPFANTRSWYYQTCNEFGRFQSSSSKNQIFGQGFPVDYDIQICYDLFDQKFSRDIVDEKTRKVNEKFGGLNPTFTIQHSTHGQLDPWRPAGIQRDLDKNSPTTIIPFEAHCADMLSIADRNSHELRAAKQKTIDLFKKWSLR